jgi:hypothetical protein
MGPEIGLCQGPFITDYGRLSKDFAGARGQLPDRQNRQVQSPINIFLLDSWGVDSGAELGITVQRRNPCDRFRPGQRGLTFEVEGAHGPLGVNVQQVLCPFTPCPWGAELYY